MKAIILSLLLIPILALADIRNCQIGTGYCQTVDGNINHYQSTGCTPFLEPFDCTIDIDLPGPPEPGKPCLTGQKIDINTSTEIQLDSDLYQSNSVSSTYGIDCSGAVITRVVYSKTGRVLTSADRSKAGLCP